MDLFLAPIYLTACSLQSFGPVVKMIAAMINKMLSKSGLK